MQNFDGILFGKLAVKNWKQRNSASKFCEKGRKRPVGTNIIELKNIKKCYDDMVVVEDFNLEVQKG